MTSMPVIKPIAGHTSVRGVSDYLQKDGRALAVDLYNLSWDEDVFSTVSVDKIGVMISTK